ncbi:MAG TPA: sulfatase-like hydrolase/transferase, partial [Candidatus Hydrogenedentes bacterium]|nr:sulfatase-like hydrolase/transferase [Candidatus Hydrogenedentota bacterium]
APTSNVPLRAGKGWLYEGGTRVPLVVRWPGVTRPGGECDQPVISTDYYPTILEMAGLAAMLAQHVDGQSLVPLLRGGTLPASRPIFWHYPHYGNQGAFPGGAIRKGDFKLIEFFEDGHQELYNLRLDPGERHDLSAEQPDVRNELADMLHAWQRETGARFPTPNPHAAPRQP